MCKARVMSLVCYIYELSSSYTICNFKQCYITKYFIIKCDFDKSTAGLHYLHIFSILTKFKDGQRLIAMSSINCLESSFCSLK